MVESPRHYGLMQTLRGMGVCKVIEIPTDPETGISVEALGAGAGAVAD
ncbi:hypothetical protein ACLK1S_27065 [Escherichia coli]